MIRSSGSNKYLSIYLSTTHPARPPSPPTGSPEGFKYLTYLLAKPTDFAKLLGVTEFYSKICTR